MFGLYRHVYSSYQFFLKKMFSRVNDGWILLMLFYIHLKSVVIVFFFLHALSFGCKGVVRWVETFSKPGRLKPAYIFFLIKYEVLLKLDTETTFRFCTVCLISTLHRQNGKSNSER